MSKESYCGNPLIKNDPICSCKPKPQEKRIATGGPGVSEAMNEAINKGIAPGELGLIIPASVNSKESLSKFLQDQGYNRGSDEYFQYYKMYSKNYKSECSYLND